jgi:hypothetical protein
MRCSNTYKLIPIWVTRWCERLVTHHVRPFNIKSSHCTSYLVWQQILWMSTRKVSWTNFGNIKEFCTTNNTKEFSTYNVILAFNNLIKWWPHANWLFKNQALHGMGKTTSMYKQSSFVLWRTMSCCLQMSK